MRVERRRRDAEAFGDLGNGEVAVLQQRPRHGEIIASERLGPATDTADLKKARVMLASGDYTKAEVAVELGVSRHTLWRKLGRAAVPSA